MVGVLALDQPHVQRERGRVGERGEKACRQVGAETTRAGQVRVRRHERVPRSFDDHHRERLGREHHAAAVRPVLQLGDHCPPDRGSGRVHFGDGLVGLDLEREVEPARDRELGEQVVEERDARGDVHLAAAGCEPGAAHSSPRSISAPSARSRSSIRS